MSNEQSTVTYSLEGILKEIQSDLAELKVGQVRLEEETKSMREDIQDLKNSSKAQIWTLIGILLMAVTGFLVALGRFIFVGNP
ncbi:MAG: hemolysin XhlA family protein [Microcystaceae cyanobacterium]